MRADIPDEMKGAALIAQLHSPAAYEHPVDRVECLETHISWVLLAGDYAYKIKKPVEFDFVDFHSLERRRYYCGEELRLNRAFAPDLYLDVMPVTVEDGSPRLGGRGPAVEYALRMRRFDQAALLDRQLEAGQLSQTDMQELASHIAAAHEAAPVIDAALCRRYLRLTSRFMHDNLAALEGALDAPDLDRLRDWTERELQQQPGEIRRRFETGSVRVCHGDLHLGNLVRLDDGIVAFDCIEFDADLRHIDVICDIAFLVMDLVARKRHDLAASFLNRYLECTGDYGGMSVFNLFFVYRCLVRAKIAALETRADGLAFYGGMALRQVAPRVPLLILMHGLSGSGKTWLSGQLLASLPCIRIRSDVERKRLAGLGERTDSGSPVAAGLYANGVSRRVYARLLSAAGRMLAGAHNVILDAAFLSTADRGAAMDLARRHGAVPVILDVTAPESMLRDRLRARSRKRDDASEADENVLDHQLGTADPFSAAERERVVEIDGAGSPDIAAIADELRARRDGAG